jgi:hypothetical protein
MISESIQRASMSVSTCIYLIPRIFIHFYFRRVVHSGSFGAFRSWEISTPTIIAQGPTLNNL